MLAALAAVGAAALLARDHGTTPWDALYEAAARRYNVPANLLRAIAWVEHNGRVNPNAKSPTGDHGIMQVNESNFRRWGVPPDKWLDPATSIDSGARYLAQVRTEMGPRFSVFTWGSAYNTGPDLQPADAAERYGSRVLWHWVLYDIGRLAA